MTNKLTLIIFLIIVIVFFAYSLTEKSSLRCEADLIEETNINGMGDISSDVRLNYIFTLNGDGIVNIIGFMNSGVKRYRLDRTLNFKYERYDSNTYEFKYYTKSVNTNDTTPNNLAASLFTTSDKNGIHYQRLSKITDDVYLIHDVAQPMLLCHAY